MPRADLRITGLLLALSVALSPLSAALLPVETASAADGITLELWPHCVASDFDTQFGGPLPDISYFVKLTESTCRPYETKDPLTRQTPILRPGEPLDMDLILRNPSGKPITRFRSWIAYDPTIVDGDALEINPLFSAPTPGESDFSPAEGYIKIGASAMAGVTDPFISVARIRMRVTDAAAQNTVLSFFNPSGDATGNTAAVTGEAGAEQGVLTVPLGSLLVRIAGGGSLGGSGDPASSQPSVPQGDGQSSSAPADDPLANFPPIVPPMTGGSSSAAQPDQQNSSVQPSQLFTLLQIQRLRATTEGTIVYLAWDALQSAELAGYNVYYGTVSGEYIQRRGVDKNSTTMTVRGLPVGTTYYFAVRGVNGGGEETAFSQEVGITVGNPATSTSPLLGSVGDDGPGGQAPNTDGTVAGDTGLPSTLVLLFLFSACVGTALAFRRQLTAVA